MEVQRAMYAQDNAAARVPAAAFLPYHHGRGDNWLVLDTAPPAPVGGR